MRNVRVGVRSFCQEFEIGVATTLRRYFRAWRTKPPVGDGWPPLPAIMRGPGENSEELNVMRNETHHPTSSTDGL